MSRWILIPEILRFRQHLVHTFLYVLKGHRGRSERRWENVWWPDAMLHGRAWSGTMSPRRYAGLVSAFPHTRTTWYALIHKRWISECAAGEEALLWCHRQLCGTIRFQDKRWLYSAFISLSVCKSNVYWSSSACLPTVAWQLMTRQSNCLLLLHPATP